MMFQFNIRKTLFLSLVLSLFYFTNVSAGGGPQYLFSIDYSNILRRFDPTTSTWSNLGATPSLAPNTGVVVQDGTSIFYKNISNSLAKYNVATNTWTTITGLLGTSTDPLCSDGKNIYGFSQSATEGLYKFNIATGTTTVVNTTQQNIVKMTYAKGAIYGIADLMTRYLLKYDNATNSWTQIALCPFETGVIGIISDGQNFYVLLDNKVFYKFNLATNSWSTLSSFPILLDSRAGMTYDGNDKIYGYGAGGNAKAYSYSILNNTWTVLPNPAASFEHRGFTYFNTNAITDLGDLPNSYKTLPSSNGAEHKIISGLKLGNLIDADYADVVDLPSTLADGDDKSGTDDEDGVILTPLLAKATIYTIPSSNMSVTNQTGVTAKLHAWIDLNNNGTFEATEYASVSVPPNATNPSGNLTWSFPSLSAGKYYIRFRLTTDNTITSATPDGYATDGEVEDYQITAEYPIQGNVYIDANKNGIYDLGEAPVISAVINVYDVNGILAGTSISDVNGLGTR